LLGFGAVGLGVLPVLLGLPAVTRGIAQAELDGPLVQECGRLVRVRAGPHRRRYVVRRLGGQPAGLLGELGRVAGLCGGRPSRLAPPCAVASAWQ